MTTLESKAHRSILAAAFSKPSPFQYRLRRVASNGERRYFPERRKRRGWFRRWEPVVVAVNYAGASAQDFADKAEAMAVIERDKVEPNFANREDIVWQEA